MTEQRERPNRPTDALSALLADPLDQGYRDAAQRTAAHGPHDATRSTSLMTAAGAFLIGIVLVLAFLHANRSAPSDARARADLRSRVTAAQRDAAGLTKTVRSLQSAADQRREAALGSTARPSLDAAALEAGTSAVHGPGVAVRLGNPPAPTSSAATGRPGSTPIAALSVLTDLDVRAVVNELWSLGAQAIAVNGVRLTPTSTIRFAGLTVLVDFEPVTAPYTVAAIGDSDALVTAFTDSSLADRYRTLASADGFSFAIEQRRDIVVPASVVSDPRYAHVPSASSPTASSPPASSPPGNVPSSRPTLSPVGPSSVGPSGTEVPSPSPGVTS